MCGDLRPATAVGDKPPGHTGNNRHRRVVCNTGCLPPRAAIPTTAERDGDTMSTTSSTDSRSEWRATVSVRIPPSDGDDLATSAGRRLQRDDDVADATVEGLRDLDPAMPATVVTVDVRVEAARTLDEQAVASRLTAAPGAECVETVRPA